MTQNTITTPELSIDLVGDLHDAEALSYVFHDAAYSYITGDDPSDRAIHGLTLLHSIIFEKIESVSKAIEAHLHNRSKGKAVG